MIAPPSAPEPLSADHALDAFACGEASLDDWLKRRALKNQSSGASRCFVLCDRGAVVGFYSLSAGGIHHENAPKPMRRNMPPHPPPLFFSPAGLGRTGHTHHQTTTPPS